MAGALVWDLVGSTARFPWWTAGAVATLFASRWLPVPDAVHGWITLAFCVSCLAVLLPGRAAAPALRIGRTDDARGFLYLYRVPAMVRPRRPSAQTLLVLDALAGDPAAWRYGYELGQQVGLKAGSLYPILIRLCDRGLLEAVWETEPQPGRPARHLYRLTAEGIKLAAEVPARPSPSRPAVNPRLREA